MVGKDLTQVITETVSKLACRKCGQSFDVSSLQRFAPVNCPFCKTRQIVPARLGHFLLIELLGKGGMARVYRAFDETLGRMVAIKVMRTELGEDPKFIENFLREARAAAQLNHRNIVQIYSVDTAKGNPYIVMELLDGGRMDEMIADGKMLDEVRAVEIGIDVAEGLNAAHLAGLIHGDVKPANVLFDQARVGKVTDFGLARFSSRRREKGEIWGTPYYIAPEKVRNQGEDHRSDIYSLGATLYHALGGKPPFEGETATDVVLKRLNEPPIRLEDIRDNIHKPTADLIARMLEADPARRYPTYASLIADMRRTLETVRQMIAAEAPVKVRRRVTKHAVIGAAAVAATIGMAVGIVIAVRAHRRNRPPPDATPKGPAIIITSTGVVISAAATETPAPVTTAVAAAGGDGGTNGAASATGTVAAATLPLQPFSVEEQSRLQQIALRAIEGKAAEADERTLDLFKSLDKDHVGRPWMTFIYGLLTYLNADDEETARRLKSLAERAFAAQPDGSPHPGAMPQALARVLIGQPYLMPPQKEGQSWPAWYGDWVDFVQGARDCRAGKTAEARDALSRYVAKTPADVSWPYVFQPFAKTTVERIEEWERMRGGMKARVESGGGAQLLQNLDWWSKRQDARLLAAQVKAGRAEAEAYIEDYRKRQAEKQRLADERKRMDKIQAELDALDDARARVLPLLARFDFEQAYAAFDGAAAAATEPEAKRAADLAREGYRGLMDLRAFVGDAVSRAPYTQGRGALGGDVVALSDKGVTVAFAGGAGRVEKPWSQVGPRLVMDMAASYVAAPGGADDKAKAKASLALSYFLYQASGAKAALPYAQRAAQLDAEAAAAVRRIMPGVLPD
jgi:hypothetical protein